MIFHETYQKVISSLGWVDKGSLWVYDGHTQKTGAVPLSNANYLVIRQGTDGYFSIMHNYEGARVEITVHHFSDVAKELSKSSFDHYRLKQTGEPAYWKFVSRYYVTSLNLYNNFSYHLLKIEAGSIQLDDDKIKWFSTGNYDFGYQGLTGVREYGNELIFTVQRDGSLYRFDPAKNEIIKKVSLAGKAGNPDPVIRDNKEIWVVDYDTLLRIDPDDWEIIKSKQLQDAANGVLQFIGQISFITDNSLCIVARPFSGDVIGLDENLKTRYRCKTGLQPVEAVLMNDTVIARDWKTGEFINGKMKRVFFG
jgi:hypothetical protein